ncbi:hypothetical protein QE375_000957 [Microbacterium foliorum]|uniref:Uncharacterized protein n=1 Tax=Microbacterium foliorum TaxID=104336 RepID=A0ABU1HMY1_9MICO|nr:hypothetical protein [Microbacterium foliorum]MDR6141403.1 hypothetical protein [Microbacterium foliorum]
MTRPYNRLRRNPRASLPSADELDRKHSAAVRFINAVSARLGIAASAEPQQVLAAFDGQRATRAQAPASLAARAGWAAPAAETPRPAAPAQAAVNALAAKAGWAAPGKA